jgi:hypothetical protein
MPLHLLAGCPHGRACAGGPHSSLTRWRPTLACWGAHGHVLGAYARWGHAHTLGGMCMHWGVCVRVHVGGCAFVLGSTHTCWGHVFMLGGVCLYWGACICVGGCAFVLGGVCTCWGVRIRVGGCAYVLGGVCLCSGACVCIGGHVHSLGGTYMSGAHAYVGGRHACMRTYLLCCSY